MIQKKLLYIKIKVMNILLMLNGKMQLLNIVNLLNVIQKMLKFILIVQMHIVN